MTGAVRLPAAPPAPRLRIATRPYHPVLPPTALLAPPPPAARLVLRHELEGERLTGRGYHRIRRVARTLADLDGDPAAPIGEQHVALALQLRVRLRVSARERVALAPSCHTRRTLRRWRRSRACPSI